MVNFILYEDAEQIRSMYKDVNHNFFGNKDQNYKIVEFDRYTNTTLKQIKRIEGKKVFLLDIDVPGKSGLDLARKIRELGDWTSPLIIITSYQELKSDNLTGKMLMLDFISKNQNIKSNLKSALMTAYSILSSYKTISVKQKGEIFQVLYDSILYIEKNVNENYVTIETKEDSITIKGCINHITKFLMEDPRFMKVHRSCIINLLNVKSYDITNNKIKFENKETDLIARDKKKELKEKLCEYQKIM